MRAAALVKAATVDVIDVDKHKGARMAVTDISKLRPELLSKSVAELERQKAEIDMALAQKAHEAEVAAKATLAADANKHIDGILAGVKFLHDNGLLHDRLVTGLSSGNGSFMPASFLRAVTPESLVGGPRKAVARSDGERRTRRRRDPVTGEMVPSKASQRG